MKHKIWRILSSLLLALLLGTAAVALAEDGPTPELLEAAQPQTSRDESSLSDRTAFAADGPAEVILTGPASGLTNTPYTFTAAISPTTASTPISYTFSASDGLGPAS